MYYIYLVISLIIGFNYLIHDVLGQTLFELVASPGLPFPSSVPVNLIMIFILMKGRWRQARYIKLKLLPVKEN